jgi:lysophospholipase L1-like esterase
MRGRRVILAILVASLAGRVTVADEPYWVRPMRQAHAHATGKPGVLLHLGDSITYSMAYFAPLQYADTAKMSPSTRAALQLVNAHMKTECYRWKGTDKGNYSGQTASWGRQHIDRWIADLRPEVALIMFGTNDIRRGSIEAHIANLRALIETCLDRGVIVILSTIPPMHGFDDKVLQTVELQRQLAVELKVPLIDFYAHVMNRRPLNWDGSLPQFESYSQWEVPTIISRDGVHPSNPTPWKRDYTEEGLSRNGNVLRSFLTLMAYSEIIRVVIQGDEPSEVSRTLLGARPPKPPNLPDVEPPPQPHEDSRLNRPPTQDWFPTAPPLPKPTGEIIRVASLGELVRAVDEIEPGGTILVADGIYRPARTLRIATDDVTLRSESGDRTRVVLDFANCRHNEGVAFDQCSGAMLADLTIANVRQNGIKINSNRNVDRIRIYNVISHNVWQRHIKGVGVPDEDGKPSFVEDCRVEYCLFYNDRPKQRGDEPWEDANSGMGFNYVGGMDVMNARNWLIRDNVFTGIHGQTGEARGAIFMWHNSTDCMIERNIIIDCDTGICLGNSSARGERHHANGCVVRNNFVVRCSESNILADHTRNCRILHNTVHDPQSRNGRLLRVIHANDGLVVANNIFSGPKISIEPYEGRIDVRNNLIRPVPEYFIDAAQGNLHLTANATDALGKAIAVSPIAGDIDGQPRGDPGDLGADEFTSPVAQKKLSGTFCAEHRAPAPVGRGRPGNRFLTPSSVP